MRIQLADHIRARIEQSGHDSGQRRQQSAWMIRGQIELATVTGDLSQAEAAGLEERTSALLEASAGTAENVSALGLGNWMSAQLLGLAQATADLSRAGKLRGRNQAARDHLDKVQAMTRCFQVTGQSDQGGDQ